MNSLLKRSMLVLSVPSLLLGVGVPQLAAQTDTAADAAQVENSRNSYLGQIKSDGVYVNSGPSESDYGVLKLNAGDQVTVVGYKYEWLKIVPPAGAVCYVPKAFVEKRGDGTIGRTTANATVRIGSNITAVRHKVGTRLVPGVDVTILGEENENFRIEPPQDVYLYVKAEYVAPVQPVTVADATPDESLAGPATTDAIASRPQPDATQGVTDTTPRVTDTQADPAPALARTQTQPDAVLAHSDTPDTSKTTDAAPDAVPADDAATPTTLPSEVAEAGPTPTERLEALEARLKEESAKPLGEQQIDSLLADYQALAEDPQLPSQIQPNVKYRVLGLEVRQQAIADFLAMSQMREQMHEQRQALRAEEGELIERVEQNSLTRYTAIGMLRPSSLQAGTTPVYRLTDPETGRTLIYIRSDDTTIVKHFGQLVGLRGVVTDDPILKVKMISSPTDITPVLANQVNNGVTATMLPPSLQTRTAAVE